MTDLLYLQDQDRRAFDATVTAVHLVPGDRNQGNENQGDDRALVVLDSTAFYVTGGGQPHDTGTLTWSGGQGQVIKVSHDRDLGEVVHTVVLESPTAEPPAVGAAVHGEIDWERRHALMRTHTAMHLLCGVIWNEYGVAVTGGNMEPLKGRMDFAFDPLPAGFAETIEQRVTEEIAADRAILVEVLPRETAVEDEDLIRTKVNLIPETVKEIRVVDIVGLDRQADGGTHVASTGEVGQFRVTKTESKGKGNKRVRFELG